MTIAFLALLLTLAVSAIAYLTIEPKLGFTPFVLVIAGDYVIAYPFVRHLRRHHALESASETR